MPYDTNGNYSLPTIYYAISGTVINPAQHNTPLEDVQAALNQTLLRNGTAAMTGNLNANGNKVTNLAAATNDSDAANYGQAKGVLTNVPSVTDWTKYQAIGAADADGRYIRSPANPNTDARILTISRNKTSGGIFAAADDGSNTQLQPAGDYATNAALSAETTRATTIESNLQSSKYDKTGGTITGTVTVEGNTDGFVVQYNPGSPASGSFINYPGFSSIAEGRGGEFHFQVQEWVGNSFLGLITLRDGGGNLRFLRIPAGLRINDSQFGDVAYTSDLGNYVTTATYNNDFATSDSRVINLAYGHKIQAFTVTVDGNGSNSHRITYPQAFSGASTAVFNCNDTGQSRSVSLANGTQPDSTGFNISVSVHGNSTGPSNDGLTLTVIAIGPK